MSPSRTSLLYLAYGITQLGLVAPTTEAQPPENMILVPEGSFTFGAPASQGDGVIAESRKVDMEAFYLDRFAVSNELFGKFVDELNYISEAQTFGWSFVLQPFVNEADRALVQESVPGADWWLGMPGAFWKKPFGPTSSIELTQDHPAVQISWNDAKAYCECMGKRLPIEEEWEYAAKAGTDTAFPWGSRAVPTTPDPEDASKERKQHRMNTWGWSKHFPKINKRADGYSHTAPVDAFGPQNQWGFYNMLGNVWEWTTTLDKAFQNEKKYVLRGGSYLDTLDGKRNHLVRVTTRMSNTPDAGSDNLGFRCALDEGVDAEQRKVHPIRYYPKFGFYVVHPIRYYPKFGFYVVHPIRHYPKFGFYVSRAQRARNKLRKHMAELRRAMADSGAGTTTTTNGHQEL
eukprot:g65037.t1